MDKFALTLPKKVRIGDITVRDGFQHEEKFISTDAKVYYAEELILAGFKRLEVTNFGNPRVMPQFKDADDVMKRLRSSRNLKKANINWDDIELTAVTIREKSVDRAIAAKKAGYGPDRVLMMVSTCEEHQYANSGLTLPEYWKEAERCIQKVHDAGMKMCGTVSTIWGSPITGPTELSKAVEFTRYFLDIGADDIEHADHDGSGPPDQVYRYFSMILDAMPNTDLHVAHFHVTRGWGLANVLAALQAGIDIFEGTMGGLGGQISNFLDDCPLPGTREYYFRDPNIMGLVSTEDMVVMLDEMGIETGIDVDHLLRLGRVMEKTIGRRLRSESALSGRIPKQPDPELRRKGLKELKASLGEKDGQNFPGNKVEG